MSNSVRYSARTISDVRPPRLIRPLTPVCF